MKKLAVLLFVLLALLASNVEAQMCPSKSTFLRIVAFDENNKPSHLSALHIAPELLPGTDDNCPNENVIAKMMEIDYKNQTVRPMPIAIEKGAVSNPVNVLTDDEIILFKEKGIVNPPKQETPKKDTKPAPIVPKKGQMTADAKADALHSSIY